MNNKELNEKLLMVSFLGNISKPEKREICFFSGTITGAAYVSEGISSV